MNQFSHSFAGRRDVIQCGNSVLWENCSNLSTPVHDTITSIAYIYYRHLLHTPRYYVHQFHTSITYILLLHRYTTYCIHILYIHLLHTSIICIFRPRKKQKYFYSAYCTSHIIKWLNALFDITIIIIMHIGWNFFQDWCG